MERFKLSLTLLALLPLYLLIQVLPFSTILSLGRRLGKLIAKKKGKEYQTTLRNLQLCFPELSKRNRDRLLRRNFESLGMAIMEMLMSWWLPTKRIEPLLAVYGREHLEEALKTHGVMLISPHFNTLELCGRLLTLQFDFAVMYRPQKIKMLDRLIAHYRKKYYSHIIPRDDIRQMIRTLKSKKVVWYAPDGDHGRNNSVFAPYFGIHAATTTGTARIAKMGNAKVLPCFFYRRKNFRGYDLYILPALDHFPSENALHDATRINKLLEEAVRKHPEQYIWQYKRFKTRPIGEKRLYS